MKLEQYLSSLHTDVTDPSFILMERCIKALEARGYDVHTINGLHTGEETNAHDIGEKVIGVSQVYHRNGAKENVSVDIFVQEIVWDKYQKEKGLSWRGSVFKVRVHRDASDKVLNNRIDKVIANM